jgi:hypothetical protein
LAKENKEKKEKFEEERMKNGLAVVFFLMAGVLFAQSSTSDPKAAIKYDPAEFPQWARDMWRFDVITFGVFPFAFFTTTLIIDSIRYFQHDQNVKYAPWPLKPAGAIEMTTDEKFRVLGISAALAASVALMDLVIIHIKRSKQKKAAGGGGIDAPVIKRTPLHPEKESSPAEETP